MMSQESYVYVLNVYLFLMLARLKRITILSTIGNVIAISTKSPLYCNVIFTIIAVISYWIYDSTWIFLERDIHRRLL